MVLTHPDFTVNRAGVAGEITDAEWWFWLRLRELESTSELGGILAWKRGFHSTGQYNLTNYPSDYSIRDAPNRRGTLWKSKASAVDWSFPEANRGDYRRIARYMQLLLASARDPNDPRLDVLYEFFGQADADSAVEGYSPYKGVDVSSDPSHLMHIHFSILREFCGDFWALWGVLTVLLGWTVAQWRASTTGTTGGIDVSNFMIQVNGQPTIHLSDGFKFRGIESWEAFLTFRDTFRWPYIVVPSERELRLRAGRTEQEASTVQAILSDAQVANIRAAAKSGALDGAGGLDLDALRVILDDESISEDEIAERFGSKV